MNESGDQAPMALWNGVLRFGLELAALAGVVVGGWFLASRPLRWILSPGLGLVAAFAWGRYRVPNDPGPAPVPVPGRTRLVIEAVVLIGGGLGWLAGGRPGVAVTYAAALLFHYLTSMDRVRWLLRHS
ncbi:MAG: YrdB family protein [Acidimicrobiia bacterium]